MYTTILAETRTEVISKLEQGSGTESSVEKRLLERSLPISLAQRASPFASRRNYSTRDQQTNENRCLSDQAYGPGST